MFLNSLYSIQNSTATPDSMTVAITINATHAIFDGHFPGAPVTPGVVQMQIVKELIELHFDKKLAMKSMRTCKFLEVLDPNRNPSVQISIKYKWTEFLEVIASGEISGKVFFKMQASYL